MKRYYSNLCYDHMSKSASTKWLIAEEGSNMSTLLRNWCDALVNVFSKVCRSRTLVSGLFYSFTALAAVTSKIAFAFCLVPWICGLFLLYRHMTITTCFTTIKELIQMKCCLILCKWFIYKTHLWIPLRQIVFFFYFQT